jgi:hypothetical protein
MLQTSIIVELLRSQPRLTFWLGTLAQAALWWIIPSCARINPEKGDEKYDLKPFVVIQRVQLPPGKGEPASRKRALHGWWQHPS